MSIKKIVTNSSFLRGMGSVMDLTGVQRTYVTFERKYPPDPSVDAAVRRIWREMGDDMRASIAAYKSAHTTQP